jgi:hypothetical protein
MSVGAAVTVEPKPPPAIAKADLARLEGLGDNCEFGFVLRRLGLEDGMLLRWASIRPESLLATLRGDFTQLYDFDNLVPQNAKMVRDLHYGTAWHSQMSSSRRAGTQSFDLQAGQRRSIHGREASKLSYLTEKLRRRFVHPNPVFVIKANCGIPDQLLEAIHYQLYRRVTSPRFLLLEVRDDADRAGTVELLDRNRMRGYLTRFASYDRSDEADDPNWTAVLAQALAHNAQPRDESAEVVTGAPPRLVILPFPAQSSPDLLAPVTGDLRGGMPERIGGNDWCRVIDDVYRLHAIGQDATTLRWTGVHLPPDFVVTVRAAYAIEESLPVRATLAVMGADGTILRRQHVFDSGIEQELSLAVPQQLPNPLTVSLTANALRPLKTGDRAVIDVAAISATPPDGKPL